MHPWTAAMITRSTSGDPSALHQRALAMRLRRFEQQRGSYEDLLDIPRHLAVLHRYDDIADVAEHAAQVLPGTLATVAYLAEIRPLIPPTERAWILVADLEVRALLSAGNLPAATRQLEAIHQQVKTRGTADPANSQWQRDLSVSRDNLGNVAATAGDLGAARNHYQASLDIRAKLATDPANTQWQRDLSIVRQRIADLENSDRKLEGGAGGARTHDRRIMRSMLDNHRAASCIVRTGYRTDGTRRAGVFRRPGPRPGPRGAAGIVQLP